MTNFEFLKNVPDFDAFSDVAILVGKILHKNLGEVYGCERK